MRRPLFRPMLRDANGAPATGKGSRYLGVRTPPNRYSDVIPDETGMISRGPHGVSVTPDDMKNLKPFLLPVSLGGENDSDPVFEINTDDLPDGLCFEVDPKNPHHGYIAPARRMSVEEYEALVVGTSNLWSRHDL